MSGLISSAKITSFFPSILILPNSNLKSISLIPTPLNIPIIKSLILKIIFLTLSISVFDAQSKAKICSSDINGSPRLSSLKQYSIRGSFKTVPSSIPNLLVIEPVATFLTMNSIGIISTSFITCSLIFNLLTR